MFAHNLQRKPVIMPGSQPNHHTHSPDSSAKLLKSQEERCET